LPSSTIADDSPHQKLFQKIPDYSYFKAFGCLCFPHIDASQRNKFSQNKIVGVYLSLLDIVKNINIKGGFNRFDESRFFSSILGFSDSAKILGENLELLQLKAIHEFQPLQQSMSSTPQPQPLTT
jgi:hypothetical protein